MSDYQEQGIVFDCAGNRLLGIVAAPERETDTGVIILVGGPQYRVGSHRQFTLLARRLAAAGIPSLRFDYTGMGDSEGDAREFNDTEQDLSAAIAAFRDTVPSLSKVVIWALCDAASASMMFAHQHDVVRGMVLLNPWVQGLEYSPEVKFAHYYRPLISGRDSWRRLISGEIDVWPALKEFMGTSVGTLAGRLGATFTATSRHSHLDPMREGLTKFRHSILVILSEDDLTAHEFSALVATDSAWGQIMSDPCINVTTVDEADHTFSRKVWQDQVEELTIEYVKSLV